MTKLKKLEPPDPVFQKDDGLWYFCDETWSYDFGPYRSEEDAKEKLSEYANYLEDL